MKILVTGSTGQLGFDVVEQGRSLGFDMIGVGSKLLDIRDKDQTLNYIERVNPDAIIHCAAYTAVDQAESDKETSWDVNVNGTEQVALAAKKVDAKLLYVSTDYVFDGEGTEPFAPDDKASPIGVYGETKFQGEERVRELVDKSFIVRISWVFGMNGNNFVKTMLKLSESRNELNVVGDQYGSPTYTYDLAKLLLQMIQSDNFGIYHASNEGYCSWADFAKEIFKQSNKDVVVHAIPTEDYPTPAKRPKNSRLSKEKLTENGFERLPSWQEALTHFLGQLNRGED